MCKAEGSYNTTNHISKSSAISHSFFAKFWISHFLMLPLRASVKEMKLRFTTCNNPSFWLTHVLDDMNVVKKLLTLDSIKTEEGWRPTITFIDGNLPALGLASLKTSQKWSWLQASMLLASSFHIPTNFLWVPSGKPRKILAPKCKSFGKSLKNWLWCRTFFPFTTGLVKRYEFTKKNRNKNSLAFYVQLIFQECKCC